MIHNVIVYLNLKLKFFHHYVAFPLDSDSESDVCCWNIEAV